MNIVILDRGSLGEDTPFDGLEMLGDVTTYFSSNEDECIERVSRAEVIIVNKVKVTQRVISAATKLRLICVFATGFDNIDLTATRERGIGVCNVPGYSTPSVAQFTVATVLSLYSHLAEYNEFVKSGEYTRTGVPNRLIPVYHEIAGKTWGIIGYGSIGSAVARIAEAMDARVIVNRRTRASDSKWVDIDTLCRESDIITIHCPLNDESRELINNEKINMMKRDVVIVNAARGAVLCEADVANAVLHGRIGGFGADVYSVEPFGVEHPFNMIKDLPNVLLTPHAAWGSYEARVRCINIICSNIKAFFEGKIQNRVDI